MPQTFTPGGLARRRFGFGTTSDVADVGQEALAPSEPGCR
jgi:hypothetical protein